MKVYGADSGQILQTTFDQLIGIGIRLNNCRRQDSPSWDSLKHAGLIIELERRTGKIFTVNEIEQMNSYSEIESILYKSSRK